MDARGEVSGSIGLLQDTAHSGERGDGGVEKETPRKLSSDRYRQPLSTMFHSFDEDLTKKLPRNSRKKMRLYLGFSCYSWFFLIAAFVQAGLVVGLQVAIAVLGNFRSGRLEEYVNCFEESIGYGSGNELPANITFPTFGRDKEIYVYFFISLVIYSFCLCLYALKFHNIVEVYMFLIINVLAIGYAGVQVYQFRGFGEDCDPVTTIGYLALANVGVLAVFTVIFVVMSRFIYVEFGWKIYTRVGCNSDLRWYYRVYEVFMSGVKLLILFLLIFLVGQCILLLYVDENNIDYEFWVVIFAMIPAAIFSYPFTYWVVRREHIIGSFVLLITNVLVIAYSGYKIYRYVTQSCPLCREQVEDVNEEVDFIQMQLNTTGSSTVENIIDRIEQFENLVLLGVINFVIAVIVLLVFVYLLKQYGKGLKEYFASESSMFKLCSCCVSVNYDVTDSARKPGTFLNLRRAARGWNPNKRRKSSDQPDLIKKFDHQGPNFNEASPTTQTPSSRGIGVTADESERIRPSHR